MGGGGAWVRGTPGEAGHATAGGEERCPAVAVQLRFESRSEQRSHDEQVHNTAILLGTVGVSSQ